MNPKDKKRRSKESAERIAHKLKHSPKYNRKWKVAGFLTTRGHTHIQLVNKKTGRPINF